ncbi:MAG: MFS transporter [Actinomycetales bacterium]|nr:MFS transporter [Actinomycetales bacterium]
MLLLAAVLVVAGNLRGPIAAIGPVIDEITVELALSPAAVGLLTGLPVLCFALAAPLASWLIGRVGVGLAVAGALALLVTGTVVRSSAGFAAAVVGTLLIGVAITAGNIAIPVVTRRDFPLLIAGVTGASTAAMNLGAMTTTAFTAPIAEAHGWRWATGVWGFAAAAALVLWVAAGLVRRARRRPAGLASTSSGPDARLAPLGAPSPGAPSSDSVALPEPGPLPHVLRRSFVWALALVFAVQSFGYYGMTAWLPQVLGDVLALDATRAGGAAAPFQAAAILSALTVPVFLARRVPPRVVFLVLVGLWLALPLGMLLAPAGWPVWVTSAGLAQGGLYTVVISVVLHRAASVADARRSSAAVQSIGYVLAATGPSVLGQLYGASGTWTVPMLSLAAAFLVAAASGSYAMRPLPAR